MIYHIHFHCYLCSSAKTYTVFRQCITLYARRAEINNTTPAIMGKVYAIRSVLDQLTRRCKHEKRSADLNTNFHDEPFA